MSNPAPEADVFPSLFRVKSASRLKLWLHPRTLSLFTILHHTAISKNLSPRLLPIRRQTGAKIFNQLILENISWQITYLNLLVLNPSLRAAPLSHSLMLKRRSLRLLITFSLLEKFSHGAPFYSQMHLLIARLGIQGAFTMSMINSKHTLISLSYYSRLWLRRIWFLQGYPMRIFKWMPTFTPAQESFISIWVCFPELPAHLFRKEALYSVASMIGAPLQIDDLTLNMSKLSQARVCVEIDLLKPMTKEFDLQINGVTIVHKVCENASQAYIMSYDCCEKGDVSVGVHCEGVATVAPLQCLDIVPFFPNPFLALNDNNVDDNIESNASHHKIALENVKKQMFNCTLNLVAIEFFPLSNNETDNVMSEAQEGNSGQLISNYDQF
ncbi:hypothetical protein Salat_2154700 [Sesamum alatum]|uniref:DUF4283 domain-containing protein n=1 Tax=Sesamum alatum TaxID=300844 RepID=A0AAE1Y2I6_9LAMI|nr:hypothetical protein Salat_2154700 [Sesamum alatum]